MSRRDVHTDQAPAALGPYSQAISAGGFVFCSGTVGVHPETGQVDAGIAVQTQQALVNLTRILEAAGTSLDHLVKTTIFGPTPDSCEGVPGIDKPLTTSPVRQQPPQP